jgi:uncharacterized protein (DUF2236 family)
LAETAETNVPRSDRIVWKVNRERVVLLGWGRAILLQLAHPLVAAGVGDHSGYRTGSVRYLRRVRETVRAMLTLTFGSEQQAREVAAGINAIHDRVHGTLREPAGRFPAGTPYSAHDPELLRWVHATLIDTMPLTYELFVARLAPWEKDAYCGEASAVAPLLGIPDGVLPASVSELETYMARMSRDGSIAVTETARTLARTLLCPPLPLAGGRLFAVGRLVTIGLLPPAIREAYGFGWDRQQEEALRSWVERIRRIRSVMPSILREWTAARAA